MQISFQVMLLFINICIFITATAFSPLGTLLTPTNRALISKLVDDDEQGNVNLFIIIKYLIFWKKS